MKKIFSYIVLGTFVFLMACNENGASVPSNDKKAVGASVAQAPDLIGEAPATVDKALQKAGFSKVEDGLALVAKRIQANANAKAKANAKANAKAGEFEVTYVYNLPEGYLEMTEAEAASYVKNLLEKGECLVLAVAIYVNDELSSLSTQILAPLKDDINLLYTATSDDLFKQLPKIDNLYTLWGGYISGEEEEYTDHAQFTAKIAAAQAIEAEEYGYTIKVNMTTGEYSGFAFSSFWYHPTDEEIERMAGSDGYAGAQGVFVVMDPSGMQG